MMFKKWLFAWTGHSLVVIVIVYPHFTVWGQSVQTIDLWVVPPVHLRESFTSLCGQFITLGTSDDSQRRATLWNVLYSICFSKKFISDSLNSEKSDKNDLDLHVNKSGILCIFLLSLHDWLHNCHSRDHKVECTVDCEDNDAAPTVAVGAFGVIRALIEYEGVNCDHEREQLTEEREYVVVGREERASNHHIDQKASLKERNSNGLDIRRAYEDSCYHNLTKALPWKDCIV